MGFKFKLRLRKDFTIDTDRDWNGDFGTLIEFLQKAGSEGEATADEIHDAIREMLADDIEHVVTLDLSDIDFEIEIPPGTTVEVPSEDEDDTA